jgi:hypothetical protein
VRKSDHHPEISVAARQRVGSIMVPYPAGRLSSAVAPFKMIANPPQCGDRQGNMGELIIRFVAGSAATE